jgi:DNA polymerase-1
MYLLLAAHADGAALQELTADGASHPGAPALQVVSAAELAGVVRELEQRRPRWIWHRTRTGTPPCCPPAWSWNAATTSRCARDPGALQLRPTPRTTQNAETDPRTTSCSSLPRPAAAATTGRPGAPCLMIPAGSPPATPRRPSPRIRRPAGRPQPVGRDRRRRPVTTAGRASSCCWRQSPPRHDRGGNAAQCAVARGTAGRSSPTTSDPSLPGPPPGQAGSAHRRAAATAEFARAEPDSPQGLMRALHRNGIR